MLKSAAAVCVLVAAALAAACAGGDGGSESQSARTGTTPASDDSAAQTPRAGGANLNCDPADANRPDRPRGEEVAGTIPPPLPRRTCTLPQRGCVAASGQGDLRRPPTPGVAVRRVTKSFIDVVYDVGSDLGECEPHRLRVTVHTTTSGLAPYGDEYPVSGRTGTLRIERKELPGSTDYGPPDMLAVSAIAERGLTSESASVRLPAPEGERLSAAEVRRIKARREACRANIDDRTSCEMDGLHPVSGPVTAATPAELARSVRDSLETYGGAQNTILRVNCFDGTRCDAAFTVSGRRLEMSYRIQALKSARTCWELTAFRVIRPVPELGNFAAPLPNQGCVRR
jgi:hypothetical protein